MALRVVGERTHPRVSEDFQPAEYTKADLKRIRDQDRRFYRRQVIYLVAYQLIVLLPIRYAVDYTLERPMLQDFKLLSVYIPTGMAIAVLLIWIFGILFVFGRRRY